MFFADEPHVMLQTCSNQIGNAHGFGGIESELAKNSSGKPLNLFFPQVIAKREAQMSKRFFAGVTQEHESQPTESAKQP
jgi:hypothetical protein